MKTQSPISFRMLSSTCGSALLIGGSLFLAPTSEAAVLVSYDIASTANGASSLSPAGGSPLTASDLSMMNGTGTLTSASVAGSPGRFAATGWSGSDLPPDGSYFQFSVTIPAGQQANFSTITATLGREGASNQAHYGPTGWELYAIVNGGAPTYLDANFGLMGVAETTSASFSTALLGGPVTGTVDFRIYGYDATGDPTKYSSAYWGGLVGSTPLALNGDVSAVPEPQVYSMLAGLGLLAFAAVRKYKF